MAAQLRTVAGDVGRANLDRMFKNQVKFGGRQDKTDYLVSLSRLESDGFRDHSATRQTQLNTRIGFTPSAQTHWTVLFNYADSPVAQNPGSLPIDSANLKPSMAWPRNTATAAGEITRQGQGGVAFEHNFGKGDLRVSAYGLNRSLKNPLPFSYILLDRNAGGVRAQYAQQAQWSGHELRLMFGSDFELQSDDRREFNNDNGRQGTQQTRDQTDGVRGTGPFVQMEAALTNRLSATLGARYDAVRFQIADRFRGDGRDDSGNRTLSAFSPRFALLYALSGSTAVYGSVGTAFQTPTTTELINRPPTPGQVCCPSGLNDQLDPQRALNFEAGVKGNAGERVRYEAVVYQMKVKDALVPFQVPQSDGREFFRNAGETRHRGVELALSAVLTRSVVLETAYTYNNFIFIDDGIPASAFEGNDLPGVPQHHVFGRLRVQPHKYVSVELEDEYTGKYFADDANKATNAPANIVDGRVLLDFRTGGTSLRPFIALNNITNEHYNSSVVINAAGARFYEPAPARNLYVGATLGFGGW
jgi:iron complex outermembrane receptor protein